MLPSWWSSWWPPAARPSRHRPLQRHPWWPSRQARRTRPGCLVGPIRLARLPREPRPVERLRRRLPVRQVRLPRDYAAPTKGTLNVGDDPAARHRQGEPDRVAVRQPGRARRIGRGLRPRRGHQALPGALRKRFDIIGFDPRGVNSSTAIRCIDNLDPQAELDPSPDDAGRARGARRSPASTRASAPSGTTPRCRTCRPMRSRSDLDALRVAVGDEKLTLSRVLVRDAHRIDLRGALPRPHPGDGARRCDRPVAGPRGAPGGPGQGLRDGATELPRRLRGADVMRVPRGRRSRRRPSTALMASIDAKPLPATSSHSSARHRPWDRLVLGARGALFEGRLADPGAGARARASTATARSCCSSPTRTGAASRTARTRTCRTPTSATPASITRPHRRRRVHRLGRNARGVGAAFRGDDRLQRPRLRLLARPARTDPEAGQRAGRAADRGRRLDRRSCHARTHGRRRCQGSSSRPSS